MYFQLVTISPDVVSDATKLIQYLYSIVGKIKNINPSRKYATERCILFEEKVQRNEQEGKKTMFHLVSS
jgi:hypothetical protein